MGRNSAPSARECQPCTACCDGWVQMRIGAAEVYPGCPCPHSTGAGCRIYAERPVDPCRNFDCAWIRPGSDLPDWMRPDRAKVIVLPDMLVWRGVPVDVAVPVGRRIPGRALSWLRSRAQRLQRLLIYTENPADAEGRLGRDHEIVGFGPPEFREEVTAAVRAGRRLW